MKQNDLAHRMVKGTTMKYYDFPTEPIGHGNPYYRCVSCHRSVPEINGDLYGHLDGCEFRKKIDMIEKIDWLKFLLKSVLDSLPQNKDWLDPEVEKAMRDACT